MEIIKQDRTGEQYYKIKHETGLTIFFYPKNDFSTSYAQFSTKYGSVDTKFKLSTDDKLHEVPEGIAHFLEHKLFEDEDGDAFAKFAVTGASVNAFTSFDTTRYLFSTTDNFYQALEILLKFVQNPYFTEKSVAKEQGIIAQEIKMYDDEPEWIVMFNLLKAMYHKHTIKENIAGTVESISLITADYLYSCYKTFYNLNNMALTIAGNAQLEKILEICDRLLKKAEPVEIIRFSEEEPNEIVTNYVEQQMPISMPLFQLGYKENIKGYKNEKQTASTEILLDIITSNSSPLYKKLYDLELINESTFSYEYFEGHGYSSVIWSGESKDPQRVADEIKAYIKHLKENGIEEQDFIINKKAIYGNNISGLNSPSVIANAITGMSFKGRELFKYIDAFAQLTLEDVENRLKELFFEENFALSVIKPE